MKTHAYRLLNRAGTGLNRFLFRTVLSVVVLWPMTAEAQNIDFAIPCPNPEDALAPITAGAPIGAPITIGSVNAPGSVSMEILSVSTETGGFETPICGTPCASPVAFLGIDMAVGGALDNVAISGTPNALLAGSDIRFTLRASSNGQQCDRSFVLPVQRTPLDLAVVLDKSGSMALGYDGSFSPPSGQRRWDGLLTGIGILASQLQLSDVIVGDSVGMRFFDSAVVTPNAPFNAGLVGMQDNVAQLPVAANAVSPGGLTALGDGIKAGRDMLLAGNVSHHKAMVVFSDGVQNTGDQVRVVEPNAFTHTVGGEDINGPADQIDIYTISLGSSGHNPLLMENVANANGGAYLNSEAGSPADFTTYFSAHLSTILAGGSPQHIALVKDQFPPAAIEGESAAPTVSQSFTVNKGVSQVQVTLIAPDRFEPRIVSLAKDGIELIQQATVRHGNGYTTLAVDYPLDDVVVVEGAGSGSAATLDGEWTVSARLGTRPRTPTPYSMMMLADDHLTDVDYNLGGERLQVGQSIHPSVGLSWNGEAVGNAAVKAIVLKPGDDINDLLATTNVDFQVPTDDPGSLAEAKLAVLMQDQAFLDKIAASDQVLDLVYDADDKRYKGSFGGLDVAGVYQAIFRLDVAAPEFGRIVRYHRQSFNARFPDIDLAASALSVGTNAQNQTLISLRPRASNGKYIGPGWGPAIKLTGNVNVLDIVDHGDGSYDIVTDAEPSGQGSITIDDETVFEGDLASLACYGPDATLMQRIRCWLIAMGLPAWSLWLLILLLLLILLWLVTRKK